MCTKIENFDELSVNVDTIVSDDVKKLDEINKKWRLKEKIISEQIELMHKKMEDAGMTQEEFEKFDNMVSFDKKISSALNIDNAYIKYKSRHIFDDDGRKYCQNGLKLIRKDEIK